MTILPELNATVFWSLRESLLWRPQKHWLLLMALLSTNFAFYWTVHPYHIMPRQAAVAIRGVLEIGFPDGLLRIGRLSQIPNLSTLWEVLRASGIPKQNKKAKENAIATLPQQSPLLRSLLSWKFPMLAFGLSSNVLLILWLDAETFLQACVRQFQELFEIQDVIASFMRK